nr:unnamed protein product [Digitaria exilis]
MPPPFLTAGGSAARSSTIRLLCTATASLPHLLALPPVAPSPAADELARLLLAHHNPFHPAESPLQLLSGGGVSLSGDLLVQLLLRLRGASKLALSLLHSARLHPSFASTRPPADAYDAVVDALGRARQFDAAWRVVVDASADGAASPRTFAVLARRLVAAGMTRQAIRAFDDMEAFVGREPDAVEFATLLDTLCKYKYPKADMLRTWRRLKRRVDEEAAKFGDEFKLYHIKPYKSRFVGKGHGENGEQNATVTMTLLTVNNQVSKGMA